MPTFEYNALTTAGRLMKGTLEASSRDQAAETLRQMNLSVNMIEKSKPPRPKTSLGRNEFILFNQQLASITKLGIPLERGLRELATDVRSGSMRRLIAGIADDLEHGTDIDKAFEKRQKAFPPLYGRILKAGVTTGRLSEMLTSLNHHLEMAGATRRIIFEATCYPAVVLVLAMTILTGVFALVVPPFKEIFDDFGMRLPDLTRLFLAMSERLASFWIGVGILVGAVFLLYLLLGRFRHGRLMKENLLLHIPVLGRLYHCSTMSRFADAMALLVSAGTDMPTSLRLSAGAVGTEKIMLDAELIAGQLEQGITVAEAGQFCTFIPRLFFYSIQLGEQRSELQDNLYSLADMYTNEAHAGQSRLQAFLLPFTLVIVGGLISIALLSLFLPLAKIISDFQ